jgi:RNA polymerase sigma-70 factor (ECF subfamily)
MTQLDTLIERWKAGDESAAAAIYDLHQTKTYRLSYGLLGNAEDAEEAAQDALTYALLNIHNFDAKRSQFATWLHMIAVSRCRDIQRKRRLPTISIADWLTRFRGRNSEVPPPEQEAINNEKQVTVWTAVQELNPQLREAITLRYWGGHTYQEIADITGCPLRTAQSRVRLAYQHLEKYLNEADQGFIVMERSK